MAGMSRIVVLDGHTLNPGDNPWAEVADLCALTVHERTAPELVVERAECADIVLTNKTALTRAVMERLPALRFISVLATGYNVVDVQAARERGVPVSNVPEYGTRSVAQYVFALLLELCHAVGMHADAVKAGEWSRAADFTFWKSPQVELHGKVMGIVGFGRIGRAVGEIARAFGLHVIATDPARHDAPPWPGFRWVETEELFRVSDVVSLNCALTAENQGLVNAGLLAEMKPSAFLINAARGGLVNEADLAEALAHGRLAGAAVDVVSTEPISPGNPLLRAPNCIVSPHIAWASLEARRRLMHATAENIRSFLSGQPINVVNA